MEKRTSDNTVAAVAAAGVVAALVTPVVAPTGITVDEREITRVSAADSLFNIPLNLFQAIVNIPNTEVGALTILGNALMYSGNWWSPSATNIWGPDDPFPPGAPVSAGTRRRPATWAWGSSSPVAEFVSTACRRRWT